MLPQREGRCSSSTCGACSSCCGRGGMFPLCVCAAQLPWGSDENPLLLLTSTLLCLPLLAAGSVCPDSKSVESKIKKKTNKKTHKEKTHQTKKKNQHPKPTKPKLNNKKALQGYTGFCLISPGSKYSWSLSGQACFESSRHGRQCYSWELFLRSLTLRMKLW